MLNEYAEHFKRREEAKAEAARASQLLAEHVIGQIHQERQEKIPEAQIRALSDQELAQLRWRVEAECERRRRQ